jgi:hypothetical protein
VEECGPCPSFASFTLAFALKLRKKHEKTSVRVIFVFYVFFVLFYVFLCCSTYCLFCVLLCIVYVYMCNVPVLLPPFGYPIAVKYVISLKTSFRVQYTDYQNTHTNTLITKPTHPYTHTHTHTHTHYKTI